jgi:UDP-N-acetylglucosamine transferase subunit ALG13
MILVTVGVSPFPFDRLLEAVHRLELEEPLVVQHGASSVRPAAATCADFMPLETLVEHIRLARAVVMHGGIGSIMVALAAGKRPLVVPRLARFGETVDDHQVSSSRRLAQAGLITLVQDPADLTEALSHPRGPEARGPRLDRPGSLAAEIGEFVRAAVRTA